MALSSDRKAEHSAERWKDGILAKLDGGNYAQAWELVERALAKHGDSAAILVAAATVLMKLDRAVDAERYVRKAAALRPDSAVVWNNVGLCLRNQNRVQESLQCFERAVALDLDWSRPHYDRAFSLLLYGDYARGFEEYEHRWAANGVERPGDSEPAMRERLWRGEDPKNKRVLLYAEQGLGDTIQFVRYARALKARGAGVALEVQPALRGVMRWLRPECEIGSGDGSMALDLHCPMMSLPLLFRTTPGTVPPPAVFDVPREAREKWEAKIQTGGRLKAGLVWAGNPENPMDDRRSTRLGTFEPFLDEGEICTGVRFFSFQVGSRALELADGRYRDVIEDLSTELRDATDTAAALLQMDLVITVDTFVAHLAASLGLPVWLLLPFAPDWRWLLEREDSPWYPSVQLFRQSSAGDWTGVSARVRDALARLLSRVR